MAVEACMNPKMMDDEDEDAPVVFKRREPASKQAQVNSEIRNSSSLRHGSMGSRQGNPNGTKAKVNQNSSKPSSVRPPSSIHKPPPSLMQRSPSPLMHKSPPPPIRKSPSPSMQAPPPPPIRKSPSPSMQASSPPPIRKSPSPSMQASSPPPTIRKLPSPSMQASSPSPSMQASSPPPIRKSPSPSIQKSTMPPPSSKASSVKPSSLNSASNQPKRDMSTSVKKQEVVSDSDSDDDKPLSARLATGLSKHDGNRANKVQSSSHKPAVAPKPKLDPDDSDDEKPLSLKFQMNANGGAPSSKQYDSDDHKPLSFKVQQNGSIKRENESKKKPIMPLKRPANQISSAESSAKRLKPCEGSALDKAKQVSTKTERQDDDDDDDDHIPIAQRMKKDTPVNKLSSGKQKIVKAAASVKKFNKQSKKMMKKKFSKSSKVPPSSGEGQKWTTLSHNGVIFPPPYKPHGVKMLYDGRSVDLTPEQEEVATMYAVMLETDYVKKEQFNQNFFDDWKRLLGKNHIIQKLEKCNFTPIYEWHLQEKEKKKQMSTEEKKTVKEEKMKQEEKYMWAIVDGVKEKVGNFRVEPPGLFRGRGEHPKMGKLKKRIHPSDITINIGKEAPVPECPIPGQRWKEIRHDNTVTWLAFWNDPINPKEFKYVFLAASSSLKGQSDKEKYEKARKLKDYIDGIRTAYTKGFTSKDMTKRQIAVATYLIDRLALRAGNEKDDDEADTVGCCTLKVENVKPIPPNILEFDFLGKDSIKYYKQFEAEPLAFKAVEQFRKGKRGSDDLFDELDTSKLNAHLKELMPGLTAKVFRTFNASYTLDNMLSKEAPQGEVPQKICVYNQANKEVAIICNHQRSVSKTHNAQMERLNDKMNELKSNLSELEVDLSRVKKGKPPAMGSDGKRKRNLTPEVIEKKIVQTREKIEKVERDMETKEDLKEIALGTSKINYLDPRITVAWCKRTEVPIEKVFNKSLLAKFAWAMDADPNFRF